MSGVGSTNAMKKGSANNPFLAYSEADMQGFLNSAYTGCIVKYTGSSTKTAVPRGQKLSLGDAQNLVVDLTKNFTYSSTSYKSREWNIGIEIENSDNTKTNQCIMNIKIDSKTGIIGSGNNDIQALIYSEYTPYSSLYGKNINEISVKFLAVTSVNVDRDVVVNWPITYGKNGWQSDCFNDLGKITLWGYGETVLAYQNQNNIDYWGHGDVIYTEPYIVNELYKVVYGDGQYYFEEFYYISENVTTATVEDVAPGKTFYDFTGTKQTGTGTKINPYIASTADDMAAYLTSSYKGAFVKYIGETVAVGGTPTPVNPIAVGDTISKLYFDTTKEVDFSKFVYDQPFGDDIPTGVAVLLSSQQNVNILTANDLSVVGMSGYVLMLMEDASQTSADVRQTILYASEALPDLGVSHAGWQSGVSLDLLQTNTISIVNAQDVWGAYISKDGQWTSGGGESYVKNAVYQVAEDGDTTRYAILPTLSNPGTAADLAQGKQLIDGEGKVVEGTAGGEIDYTQDVMFWDYDGTLIYACTLEEAKAMTKLPDAPSHVADGLVFDRWNWTLEELHELTAPVDVGAMYVPADGNSHIFINVDHDNCEFTLCFSGNNTNSNPTVVSINWGDGNTETHSYVSESNKHFDKTHVYSVKGEYDIIIQNITSDTAVIYKYRLGYINSNGTPYGLCGAAVNRQGYLNKNYLSSRFTNSLLVKKVYIGDRCAGISIAGCIKCGTKVGKYVGLSHGELVENSEIKHINATSLSSYVMYLSEVETCSFSKNVYLGYLCFYSSNLKRIAIYNNGGTGDYETLSIKSLRFISIANSFYAKYTGFPSLVFVKKATIGANRADATNYSSIEELTLSEICAKISDNSNFIANSAVKKLIVKNNTPPTLSGAFSNIQPDLKIYVPDDVVDTYKSTKGWSEMADRIYPISALTN